MPLNACGPNASHSNKPCTRRYVAALITTVLGAACPCTRAAMLGVSPKAKPFRALPRADLAHHHRPGVNANPHL